MSQRLFLTLIGWIIDNGLCEGRAHRAWIAKFRIDFCYRHLSLDELVVHIHCPLERLCSANQSSSAAQDRTASNPKIPMIKRDRAMISGNGSHWVSE